MGWNINSATWTGAIVTVGAGKDYTSLKDAIASTVVDALYLVDPGAYYYSEDVAFSRDIYYYIRGMGAQVDDVAISFAGGANQGFMFSKGHVLVENLKIGGSQYCMKFPEFGYPPSKTLDLTLNKCHLYGWACIGFGRKETSKVLLNVNHTYLETYYGHIVCMCLNKISLNKVSYNSPWKESYCYDSPLALNDSAVHGTDGYGCNYGDFLITESGGGLAAKEMHYRRLRNQ